MIRLVQRRLIIPRGDTGTFSVPVLSSYNSGDAAVFSIIDPRTHRRVYNQLMYITDNVLSVKFEYGDTVNLPVGKFLWDIKFYQDPVIEDNQVVSGKEVDSYYAAFTMPECEIRQTGDNMLTADDAPGSTLTPQHINAINAALFALNEAVEKTETNVTHYPTIIDGEWNVWDANLGDYTTTGIKATGNGIASIEKTNTVGLVDTYTVNFTDGTTFLYNITNGSGISSITKQSTSGLEDTYVIIYTDGNSTTFTVTNGATPNISIGTVQEGPIAAASITGSLANPVLNLTLPNANVPTRVSELENDAGYLSVETDPTVPQWAKQPTKPTYTAQEVGALPSNTYIPEKTSDLTNDSNYAVDANYIHTDNNYTTAEKEKLNSVAAGAEVNVNADWNANSGDAQILNKPTNVSAFTNDVGYLTNETDPTVPAWAKAVNKPTYTAAEVGAPTVAEMQQAIANVNTMKIYICAQGEYNSETGVPTVQNPDTQTFYLVPGGEGSNLFIEWIYVNNSWERFGSANVEVSVQDVQVNGASIVSNGIANIQKASSNNLGVVGIEPQSGVEIASNGKLEINPASTADIKEGENTNKPIVPFKQDVAAFYGLATAAGDATQSVSNNPVGTYTDEAKAAIQQMLDVPSTSDIPEMPVTDVQINSTSILDAQGVANVPIADSSNLGVVKAGASTLIGNSGVIEFRAVGAGEVKAGTTYQRALTPERQHASVFYGLAKAAGDTTQSQSDNAVGQYTNEAKTAIQTMLDVPAKNDVPTKVSDLNNDSGYLTSFTETDPTVPAWAKASTKPSYTATEVGALPSNTHIPSTTAELTNDAGFITNAALPTKVSDLTNDAGYLTSHQDISGKANSADLATVATSGDYDDLINKPTIPTVPVQSVNSQTGSVVLDAQDIGAYEKPATGIPKTDLESAVQTSLGKADTALQSAPVTSVNTKIGAVVLTPSDIGAGTYSKPSGGIPASDLAAGVIPTVPVQDVQVNGASVLSGGVANVPIADSSNLGVIKIGESMGIDSNGAIDFKPASGSDVIAATSTQRAITPKRQHEATFFGLAKAAGDTTQQSAGASSFGNYTESAKSAISQMLNGAVSVSGTTPTIAALSGVRYACGEVATLSFTPSATGICDVVFTSGSTATVLTVPSTVKWPAWFNPAGLESNVTYELNVLDGVYGAVGAWS